MRYALFKIWSVCTSEWGGTEVVMCGNHILDLDLNVGPRSGRTSIAEVKLVATSIIIKLSKFGFQRGRSFWWPGGYTAVLYILVHQSFRYYRISANKTPNPI